MVLFDVFVEKGNNTAPTYKAIELHLHTPPTTTPDDDGDGGDKGVTSSGLYGFGQHWEDIDDDLESEDSPPPPPPSYRETRLVITKGTLGGPNKPPPKEKQSR